MAFKRKIYNELLSWKNEPKKNSALLIEGARRVGKTTIVKEFAKNEYKNFIYIDFTYATDEINEIFKRMNPNSKVAMDQFFADLMLFFGKDLRKGDLIIFDEVQFFPRARQAIKALVADGRFDYIETGSLISIRENVKDIQIPSEERRIEMHPMDFEEFCWAIGEDSKCDVLREIYKNKASISETTHQKMMNDFRLYLALGGMPKVVSLYLETNSFARCEEEKRDILKLYEDDLRRHDTLSGTDTSSIYSSMLPSLQAWSKRVKTRARSLDIQKKYLRSLEDLQDSRIVNAVYRSSDISPLSLLKDKMAFKLYPLDAGLMLSSLLNENSEDAYKKIRLGKLDGANFGPLYECLVAQSLVFKGKNVFYHTFEVEKEGKEKRYEIDFVTLSKGKLVAIETKSTKRFSTSSLNALDNKYPQLKISKYVVSPKPLSFEGKIVYLPIYMLDLVDF